MNERGSEPGASVRRAAAGRSGSGGRRAAGPSVGHPGREWDLATAIADPDGVRRGPDVGLPEVALAGRSNTGKSSLLNALTRRRGLARTSSTPGRTQQVLVFAGPEPVALADLPGYGWARASRGERTSWARLIDAYLRGREALRGLVVVIDARRGIGPLDEEMLARAAALELPWRLVVTKVDKLKRAERDRLPQVLGERAPAAILFSARTGEGRDDVWRAVADLAGLR